MKKLGLIFTLTLTSLGLFACGNGNKSTDSTEKTSASTEKKVSSETMNVGILPSESAIPIILAKENGYFSDLGLNVEIKPFTSPNDRNVAIQAKELTATISDVMTEATFKKNAIDMTITSGILEDFKVLSSPNSGITEMKQLQGKHVTLVPNFILEYIMDEFAKKDDFTYEITEIDSFSARSEALLNDQVDGAVYTEPQASMLEASGAHVLGSSKEAEINGGTIQFMTDVLKDRPQDVTAFYKGYNQAIDYMNEHKASEYAEILSKYQFPDAMSQYLDSQTEKYPHATEVSKDIFESIISWAKDKGQIDQEYTYDDLTDFQFIK